MHDQELMIESLRKDFVESIVKYIDKEIIYVQLFQVYEDLTYNLHMRKFAGRVPVLITIAEICKSSRYIKFTISFDKYVLEHVLYTSSAYSIRKIVSNFFNQVSDKVRQSFVDNNEFAAVREINNKIGILGIHSKLKPIVFDIDSSNNPTI